MYSFIARGRGVPCQGHGTCLPEVRHVGLLIPVEEGGDISFVSRGQAVDHHQLTFLVFETPDLSQHVSFDCLLVLFTERNRLEKQAYSWGEDPFSAGATDRMRACSSVPPHAACRAELPTSKVGERDLWINLSLVSTLLAMASTLVAMVCRCCFWQRCNRVVLIHR